MIPSFTNRIHQALSFQRILMLALPTFLTVTSPSAWSWGQTGHRTVALIATRHLSKSARAGLNKIFNEEIKDSVKSQSILPYRSEITPALFSDTLVRAATWPDEERDDSSLSAATLSIQASWHFVDIPDGMTYEQGPKASTGDAYTTLVAQEAVIENSKASSKDKANAIRWITHLLGDIHQPLHVGNTLDAGANLCKVNFFGSMTNLHAIWDDAMIDSFKLTYREYADFIDHVSVREIEKIEQGTYLDWIAESQHDRAQVYPASAAGAVSASNPALPSYCTSDTKNFPVAKSAAADLSSGSNGYIYVYNQRPLLEKKLVEGGLRLAATFNRIFADRGPAGH